MEITSKPLFAKPASVAYPKAPVRILVIDDDEEDFMLTRRYIESIPDNNFQIDWCGNFNEGRDGFARDAHDIYFIDYFLGAKTGIELLKEAIQMGCNDPIILLTGQGNKKIDLEALRYGATDFLNKSELTSDMLDRCIRYSLERAAVLKGSQANEIKFRTIFERTLDAMFLTSDQLKLKDVNPAMVDMLGYSTEELFQLSIYDLMIHNTEKEELSRKLSDQNEVIDFNAEFLTKNRLSKICILSISFEKDTDGNRYLQGIIRDISLLKRIEDIRLQSEKLESKGLMIRTLAHEIRNPLHNITLSLGFLKTEIGESSQEFLNVIERNSKRINDLINQLMDSNQYYKMKLEVTPLQVVLRETLEITADQIVLNNIKLNLNFPKEDARALIDREKIKVALLNVVVNAIESMTNGMGELDISISSDTEFHKVTIKDNGCGMSEELVKTLFEPYITSKPKGLGLGLAATYAIIQSHKADIEVTSEINKGTTFTFSFPSL